MLIATHFCSLSTAHVNVFCCRDVHFHSHFPRMQWGKHTTTNTLGHDTAMKTCLSLLRGLVSFSVCWSTGSSFLVMCLARLGGWKVGDRIQENAWFFKSHFLLHILLITSKRFQYKTLSKLLLYVLWNVSSCTLLTGSWLSNIRFICLEEWLWSKPSLSFWGRW